MARRADRALHRQRSQSGGDHFSASLTWMEGKPGMRNFARRRLKGSDGYTLTEMLIVVLVISMIAGILVPTVVSQMRRARAKTAHVQLENVASAVEVFRSDTGHYPKTTEGGLKALLEGASIEGWTGPYLKD